MLCAMMLLLTAAEADDSLAFVRSKEVLEDGKLFKATVKITKAGTYWVAAGYVKDHEGEFKFLKSKTGTKYYELRKIVAEKDGVSVELSFMLKAVPPLGKPLERVAVFLSEDDIPETTP